MASDDDVVERLNPPLAERYHIESEIGSGGMATVYLAQDLKHDRKVAVKVMKPELAAVMGTERFLAEIRTTANLSHPHILPLYDSGEADGFLFYVMPYVEGESLKEKLDRDGQLPVEEAVRIAGHVADALDYAHRHGVIHRDVKPANILFQEGEPSVTDFGIALAVSAAGEGRLTETGLSLGTPYYMSPEQAAGDRTPTAASDVYSLGCVLYEMLTGEPPHTGASAQAILGKILLADITRPTTLRRTIPANVEAAVLKALERLPADRFESAGELVAALKDRTFRHGVGVGAAPAGRQWKVLAIGFGALVVLALAAVGTGLLVLRPAPPPAVWQPILPPGRGIVTQWARYFALAPDGSSMVYADTVGLESGWQLFVKNRGAVEGRLLSGTERASDVVYSPDGRWIAYRQGNNLVKRPVEGAGAQTIFKNVGSNWAGIDWMADGTILCEAPGRTLVRIPADMSGPPDTAFVFPRDAPIWVRGLPGGEAALVVRCAGGTCTRGSYLTVVDFAADTTWMLQDEVLRAWYVPSGHVVWVRRDGTVFATPFDLDRLDFSGDPESLFEGVGVQTYIANMVMTGNGTVVYSEGDPPVSLQGEEVVWVDRAGRAEPVDPDWGGPFGTLALSPDGRRLAVDIAGEDGWQIWVKILPDGPATRLTAGDLDSYRPAWSPDGETVAYHTTAGGKARIGSISSDGRSAGAYEVLLEGEHDIPEAVYTPDGGGLLFFHISPSSDADLGYLDLTTGERNDSLLATEFVTRAPVLSPDGRWLAYTSNATGRDEVFVRPFPEVDRYVRQVSRDGGAEPVWAREGAELFYRGADGWMMVASYSADPAFNVEEWTPLFDASAFRSSGNAPNYDVSQAGDRFVMVLLRPLASEDSVAGETRLIMIQNFFTELEEKMAGGR